MVEEKLRVELTQISNDENPFYGKTTAKKVVEETFYHDKDERDNIAPFGIMGTIAIERSLGNTDVFDIKLNKYYFEEDELPNTYHCFFTINDKIYELCLGVKDDQIADLTLCEWVCVGYFEDGEDADNIYGIKEFTSFLKMYL